MSVNDQILDAIELLAQNSVERAGYDKTIQAQIVSCQDKTLGKYKCRYQDAIFYAYASNPNINLSNGTMVYILVPQNDMSKEKTIIGIIDKLGVDFITIAEGEDAYEKVGVNSITAGGPFYLNTNNIDYSYDNVLNDITLNSTGLVNYVNNSSSLIIAATIQTDSPLNRAATGLSEYGIAFTATFSNSQPKDYILNEDNMVGDPFQLISATRQVAIFPIDGANFTGISKIRIYNKNFDDADGTVTGRLNSGDIIISNLQIYGANRLSQQQLNGVMISLYTPDGSFFSTADAATTKKRIMAQIKVKGQVVSSEGVPFYWGLEDMNVTSSHSMFNQYLGYGWRHLTAIDGQTGWNSEDDYIILQKSDVRCSKNTYKVAAIYDGNLITRQIDIKNLSTGIPVITIESNDGTEFFNNMGNPTLTCSTENATPVSHRWGWSNNGGYFEQAADVIGQVSGNVLSQVQISKINGYADFKCTVYDSNGYLGTGVLTLTNEQNDKSNYLTIVNGQAVFKYTEGGAAPNSDSLQNPQLIIPLTFEFRDSTGATITPSTIATSPNGYIKWSIPNKNTLLVDENNSGGSQQGDYTIYENVTTLSFNLVHTFDYNKTNNQIRLQINYNGIYVEAQTRFVFTKQGDIGTNGTEYIVRIVLNTQMTNPPLYPVITNVNGTNKINYGIGNTNSETTFTGAMQLFKAELWRSGERIWYQGGSSIDGSSAPTVVWSVVQNKYSSSNIDSSDFTVSDATTGTFTYSDSTQNNLSTAKANIIQCAVTYENKIYYGTIPVTTAYVSNTNYRINLKDNTGFRYAIYSADGAAPQYDSTSPFTIEVKDGNTLVTTGTYSFGVEGSVRGSAVTQLIALATSSVYPAQANQKWYKPIARYDGQCVNNAVTCEYSGGGVTAKIRIPVHLLLNRFGMANINLWDGNSVKIDDTNGGYILAPQIGAGEKDANNRFTGVVMGKVREANKTNTNTGLFGYASGARTFFLDSQHGSAIFGKSTGGQIIIDPDSTKALLYSSNFWSNYNATTGLPSSYLSSNEAGAGMLIDLSTPAIRYGNGGFSIDSQGNLSTGQGNFNVSYLGAISAGKVGNNYNFTVDTSGNISITGAITANSGKIGGINGWTIGYDNTVGSERGYIYSGNRTSLNSTASGLYVGTDGISAYKSGTGITFKVDSSGNVTINGNVTLGSGSSVSWNALPNDVVAENDLADVAFSGDYEDLDNQPDIPTLPSYIKATYIDSTRIESPDIYAGQFYATGSESQATTNTGAAYYIYDGYSGGGSTGLGNQIGYICYDTGGSGSQGGEWVEATNRVIFATQKVGPSYNPRYTALKFKASGNMSLETGCDIDTDLVNTSAIYFMNATQFSNTIKLERLNATYTTFGYCHYVGAFGYNLPPDRGDRISDSGYQSGGNEAMDLEIGQLFFLLD